MIEKEITIKIKVDEENISKLYNNYDINYNSVEEFIVYLINHLETDTEMDGKPFNHLKEWGYDIVCITD